MAHLFAGPLNAIQRKRSLRAAQQRPPKRKRDDDEDSPSEGDRVSSPSRGAVLATLTAADAYQYRVAGHLPGDEIPSAPFPHRPVSSSRAPISSSDVQKELASLKPAFYAPGISANARLPHSTSQVSISLRQRHLGALTTALHVCLLRGDYQRAGRAWGMVLRTKDKGQSIDVRKAGRWGISAELLLHKQANSGSSHILRQSSPPSDRSSRTNSIDSITNPVGGVDDSTFTVEGFEAARQYYNRLILQHPYHKSHPNAINAVTFYPVMFSLWIFEVWENSKRARQTLDREFTSNAYSETSASENDSSTISGSEVGSKKNAARRAVQERAIQEHELEQAKEIAARLDGLLIAPPFESEPSLLHIMGMVALWISDLVAQKAHEDSDEDVFDLEEHLPPRQHQLQKAKELFKRVGDNGGKIWHGVNHLLIEKDG